MEAHTESRRVLGQKGESWAASFLEHRGYQILERNYRHGRGEIDIIAQDRGIYVFVEVKTRVSSQYGSPQEAVTRAKQRQLAALATLYLQRKGLLSRADCRFDVIAIQRQGDEETLEHIIDAFRARRF
jgi:putative endonuclease